LYCGAAGRASQSGSPVLGRGKQGKKTVDSREGRPDKDVIGG
jgi:hypothetical protein